MAETLDIRASLDKAVDGLVRFQSSSGVAVEDSAGDVRQMTEGNGLDVLRSSAPDNQGFRPVDIDISQIFSTPQLFGRILLFGSPDGTTYRPGIFVPKPGYPNIVRATMLPIDFDPRAGLTQGLIFGTALEAETQAPGFGGHGNGKGPSGLEPGHLATAVTAAVDIKSAERLRAKGDKRSHEVISAGVPQVLGSLGQLQDLPLPVTQEVDVRTMVGVRLPLSWHEELETADGGALARYEGAAQLLLGRVFHDMTDKDIERTSSLVTYAIRGAEQ